MKNGATEKKDIMHTKDKKPYNEFHQRHGLWLWHSFNGMLMLKAHYINDVPYGYLEFCSPFYGLEKPIEYEYYAR